MTITKLLGLCIIGLVLWCCIYLIVAHMLKVATVLYGPYAMHDMDSRPVSPNFRHLTNGAAGAKIGQLPAVAARTSGELTW